MEVKGAQVSSDGDYRLATAIAGSAAVATREFC